MKKLLSLLLVLSVLFSLGACSGSDAPADPNLGTYVLTSASAFGLSIDATQYYQEFELTLKAKNKCSLRVDGKSANGTWKDENGVFSFSAGGVDCTGTMDAGVIELENVMDSGLTLELVCPEAQKSFAAALGDLHKTAAGLELELAETIAEPVPEEDAAPQQDTASAPAAAEQPKEAGKNVKASYSLVSYTAGAQTYADPNILQATGLKDTVLEIYDDGTGKLVFMDTEYDLAEDASGKLSLPANPYFTFTLNADGSYTFDMAGSLQCVLVKD